MKGFIETINEINKICSSCVNCRECPFSMRYEHGAHNYCYFDVRLPQEFDANEILKRIAGMERRTK